jgi:hypothetical protein
MNYKQLSLAVLITLPVASWAAEITKEDKTQEPSQLRLQPAQDLRQRPTSLVEEILSAPATREIQRNTRDSGTGIGGGSSFERLITWCDEASIVLNEARVQARELWGANGDVVGALSLQVDGLNIAADSAPQMPSTGELYTARYVNRGLVLSDILGIDKLIAGSSTVNRQTLSLMNFMDWYLGYTRDVGQKIDRSYYAALSTGRRTQVRDIEDRIVSVTIGTLRELDSQFVRIMPDRTNLYTTIPVPTYLKAVAYMSRQMSYDLDESIYSEAFTCQAGRLIQLAAQIDSYIASRRSNSQDAIQLNRFSLSLRDIVNKLDGGHCF